MEPKLIDILGERARVQAEADKQWQEFIGG